MPTQKILFESLTDLVYLIQTNIFSQAAFLKGEDKSEREQARESGHLYSYLGDSVESSNLMQLHGRSCEES